MAVIKTDFNVMNLPMAIERNNPIPLDSTALWYSYDEMATYAKESSTAYVGQILSLVVDNEATAYIILNTSGDLKEVGSATLVDNTTIVLNDGAIAFKDFGKRYYKYVPATETEEATYVLQEVDENNPWIVGLEPKVASENGQLVLGWYEPNPTTVEGISSTVASLQTTVNDLGETVRDLSNDVAVTNAKLSTVYTKDETNTAIAEAVAAADHLAYKKVNSIGDIQDDIDNAVAGYDKTIYLVPSLEGLSQDVYEEYMVIDNTIERVGSWQVNLDEYATKTELENKVDKQDGYDLVSAADIAKLGTVETGAQKNYISEVSENFDVTNGKLTIVSVPNTVDLSGNNTIAALNAVLSNKVSKEDGKSLVADELIAKLEALATDAEKNYINDVTSEFNVDENRVLSIVSVSGDKIVELSLNQEFSDLSSQVDSAVTDIEALNTSLAVIEANFAAYKTEIANTYVSKTDHQASIDEIMAILTWQELEEPTTTE